MPRRHGHTHEMRLMSFWRSEPEPPARTDADRRGQPVIVVADDDRDTRELYRAFFDLSGFRTAEAANGHQRKHEAEYAWFAISDALPGLSTSAERAARQILDACRYGDPELTINVSARTAVAANHLLPAAVAHVLALANRVLPGPTGTEGDRHRRGREASPDGRHRPPRH